MSLSKGSSYRFQANGVSSFHPFRIGTTYGDESASWIVRTGTMSGSSGYVDVHVPSSTSVTQLAYWCAAHGASMLGSISIV